MGKLKILCLVLGTIINIQLFAQKKQIRDSNVYWEINNDVLTISGSGRMPDFSWHTDEPWMNEFKLVRKVIIEYGVTSIGNYAFSIGVSMGDGPSSIFIPNSVTSIGASAFHNWKNLASVIIPESVLSIEDGAFNGCVNLREVLVPESVTSIGFSAFENCNSLIVTIPASVTSIRYHAFDGVKSVSRLVLNNNSEYAIVVENNKYGLKKADGSVVVPIELEDLEPIGKNYLRYKLNGFWGVMNYQGKIIIPTDRGYTYIGDYVSFTKRFPYTMAGYKGECDATGRQISKIKVATPQQAVANSSSSSSSSSSASSSSNSGNSNGGTTTVVVEHHRDPVPVQQWQACWACGGMGTMGCDNCGGSGTKYIGDRLHRCSRCNGRGIIPCNVCYGNKGQYVTVYK